MKNKYVLEITQVDQEQAHIFMKKAKEKLNKLEEKYKQAKGYERNSIYQKMRVYKKYFTNGEGKYI